MYIFVIRDDLHSIKMCWLELSHGQNANGLCKEPEIRVLAEMLKVSADCVIPAGCEILLRTKLFLLDNSFKQNLSASCKCLKDNGGFCNNQSRSRRPLRKPRI